MKRQFNSYVDSDFLKAFLAKRSEFDIEESGEELETWRSLLKFYLEKSKIALKLCDTSLGDLVYNLKSALTRYMLNQYSQGSLNISIENITKNQDATDPLKYLKFNFIFSNENETFSKVEEEVGIEYISGSDFLNEWKLYAKRPDRPIQISSRDTKDTQRGWDVLKPIKHPCNAMIISDRYFLINYWNMINDLFPILKALLPKRNPLISFDLTIFIEKVFRKCRSKEEERLDNVYKRIESFVKHELKCENLNLTLVKLPGELAKKIHDRHIYTNYFILYSGFGFGCFDQYGKSKLNASTTLDVFPITEDSPDAEVYKSFLREKKDVLAEAKDFIGSKENRLFELI
jgi:hypothetical protein